MNLNNIEAVIKTLREALNNNDIAIIKCLSTKSTEEQDILCAVNKYNESVEYIPLVALINNNPYKSLLVKSIEWEPTRAK